jgi:hypothetical protein
MFATGTALAGLAACSSVSSTASTAPHFTPSSVASPPVPARTVPVHVTLPSATAPATVPGNTPLKVASTPSPDACSSLGIEIVNLGGAAGSSYQQLQFTNDSSTPCTLGGYPGVSLTTSQDTGSQIGSAASKNSVTQPTVVTLAPGKEATSQLRITDAGNYPQTQGHTEQSAWLQVYAPGSKTPVYLPDTVTGTTVTSVNLLAVSPVV